MPVTVVVSEATGVTPDFNEVTEVRFNNDDNHAPVLATPCVIPSAGFNYSYWKHLFLSISGAYARINNVQFYTDGASGYNLGTGGDVFVGVRDAGDNGCPDGSYERSAGAGDTGYWMDDGTNGHDYYKAQVATPASAFDYTSVASLEIDTANYDNVADRTDGVVLQAKVDTDATRGAQAAESCWLSFDEI